MSSPIDRTTVVPLNQMRGEDDQETRELVALSQTAERYLLSFRWCRSLRAMYFGAGIGGVVAAFAAHIEPSSADSIDQWLWVVVGDIPSAYFVTDNAKSPAAALRVDCALIEDWIAAIRGQTSFDGVFPVDAPRTPENAEALAKRLRMVREDVIPYIESSDAPPHSGRA